ncbi:MAG TPA: Wzt carbohydrate-binding domain-containing protein [Rhizomicrobium sp.]
MFGADNVSPWISGRSELWAQQRYAHYAVITGHFHSPIPMNLSPNGRARITMLRDPIERAISEYYYYRNDVGRVEWNKLAVLAKDYDLYGYVKFLQAKRDMAISNLYARRFASQVSRYLWSEKKVLELAKAALERYDFVGIQEQFVDSVDLFCCQFRLPPVPVTPRANVTSSRKGLRDVDADTYARLVDMNRLDVELYESACRRLENHKRRVFHAFARGGPSGETRSQQGTPSQKRIRADTSESLGDRSVEFRDARLNGSASGSNILHSGEEATLSLIIDAHENVPDLTVGIEISDELGEIVFGTNTHLMRESRPVSAGVTYRVEFIFAVNMKHGQYFVGASLHTGATHEDRCFHWRDRITKFDVVDDSSSVFVGYCRLQPELRWREL